MSFMDQVIQKFSRSKPFYCGIFCNMKRVYNNKLPYAAGIDLKNFQLMINPKMLEERGEEFAVAALEHEILHLLYRHVVKMNGLSQEDRQIYNYATDCHINQSIKLLNNHSDVVNPNSMSKKMKLDVPYNLTSEAYFSLFKQHKDKLPPQDGIGELRFDDHGEPSEDFSESKFTRKVLDVIQKTKELLGKRSMNGIDPELSLEINELLNPKLPWRTILRQFHAKVQNFTKEKSRKKRNRRYGLMFQGKKRCPTLKIAVCVDTSGSMSDGALNQVWSELNSMYSVGTSLIVIEADSVVQNVYEFTKNSLPQFKGRGGTAYSPAIERAVEEEVDAIIYIGDFDSSDIPQDPKIPFLWVGIDSRGQNPPGSFGKTIHIN